jgi:hypothetical protein
MPRTGVSPIGLNLFYENCEDVFVEVQHTARFLLDNNLLLSDIIHRDCRRAALTRTTCLPARYKTPGIDAQHAPIMWRTATKSRVANIPSGANRFFNNLFVGNAKAEPT